MKRKVFLGLGIGVGILIAVVLVISLLPARIDCGESEIYTLDERESAASLIADKISSFEGCKLFSVKYDGDDASRNNLSYCNELAEDGISYVDCIVFTSYFRSPIFDAGAWNPNEMYSWSWYLARTNEGGWNIVAYGYA